MRNQDDMETRASLLSGLTHKEDRERFDASWKEFVVLYTSHIRRWIQKKYQLSQADTDDIVSSLMLVLLVQMESFTYDPQMRFRGWLKTVALRTARDYLERNRKYELADLSELQNVVEQEFDRSMYVEAMKNIKRQLGESQDWMIFNDTTLEHEPIESVASRLGKSVDAVYQARARIKKRLREEFDRLERITDSSGNWSAR